MHTCHTTRLYYTLHQIVTTTYSQNPTNAGLSLVPSSLLQGSFTVYHKHLPTRGTVCSGYLPTLLLQQISWVRRRDWHILSSGLFTYTNDERFQILHAEGSDDWTLQIKYVQKRDNGTYECQVSEFSCSCQITCCMYEYIERRRQSDIRKMFAQIVKYILLLISSQTPKTYLIQRGRFETKQT